MNEELVRRIAQALGWSEREVTSLSMAALRDVVRPVSHKLAGELTEAIAQMGTARRA